MDRSVSPTFTLSKLIQAQQRGVKVCLCVDDLNFVMDKELVAELRKYGGIVYPLNKFFQYTYPGEFRKKLFHRHHEKVIIVDDEAIVGSCNLTDEYSGPLYGTESYMDVNAYLSNICLCEMRQFFADLANYYRFKLVPEVENQDIVDQLNAKYPDSLFNLDKVSTIRTVQPYQKNINEYIVEMIQKA